MTVRMVRWKNEKLRNAYSSVKSGRVCWYQRWQRKIRLHCTMRVFACVMGLVIDETVRCCITNKGVGSCLWRRRFYLFVATILSAIISILVGQAHTKYTCHLANDQSSSSRSNGVPPSMKKETRTCTRLTKSLTAELDNGPLHISKCRPLLVYCSTKSPGGWKSLAVESFWIWASKVESLAYDSEQY